MGFTMDRIGLEIKPIRPVPFHLYLSACWGYFILAHLEANVGISSIFKHPALGIRNCSYTAVFDLIECIVNHYF